MRISNAAGADTCGRNYAIALLVRGALVSRLLFLLLLSGVRHTAGYLFTLSTLAIGERGRRR